MTTLTRPAPPRRRVAYERWIVWGGPFAVSMAVSMFWPVLHMAIAGLLGAAMVAWLSRRPGLALRVLVVFLPFQLLGLAALYRIGFPREIVRPLGLTKEVLVGGVVVAAVRVARASRVRLDTLDKVALGYVGLATAFLLFPSVLVSGPGAEVALGTRLNGFRTDAMYVLLFVAARHARLPAADVVRVARTFVVVALAAAAIGVFEFLANDTWHRFVTETLQLARYKIEVLGVVPGTDPYLFDPRVYSTVGGRELLRIGGLLVDYAQFGFWLTVAAALVLERQVRRLDPPVRGLAVGLLALGVLFTQTRSAVVGLAAVLLLAIRRQPGRAVDARVRVALVVGTIAVVVAPVMVGIGLAARLGGDAHSDDLHAQSSSDGFELLLDDPVGRGLSTAAGAGQRDGGTISLVTENQLLQIGTQLGVVGLALWVGTYVGVVVVSNRRSRVDDGDRGARAVSAGTALALTALAPSMWFLQIYIYFPFAWTLWALAGASLGALEAGDRQPALTSGDRR